MDFHGKLLSRSSGAPFSLTNVEVSANVLKHKAVLGVRRLPFRLRETGSESAVPFHTRS